MRKKSDAQGRVNVSIDWRSAPLRLLEVKELCFEARLLMTWLFMHGNGWVFRVGYALQRLGVSESTWLRKVRPQLIETGFFKQRRLKGEAGSPGFCWDNEFSDEPLRQLDENGRLSCQIEGIQTECIAAECMQGDRYTGTRADRGSNKQERENKRERKTAALSFNAGKEEPPPALPSAPPARVLADREKEKADLEYAMRIGKQGGLQEQEIERAIQSVRFPSQAPAAVEAAIRRARLAAPPSLNMPMTKAGALAGVAIRNGKIVRSD